MKRFLSIMLLASAFISSDAIVVKKLSLPIDKHLGEVLTEQEGLTIDSLVITKGSKRPLDATDFASMAYMCEKGKLSGIDLSGVKVQNGTIPERAFIPSVINSNSDSRSISDDGVLTNLRYIRLPYNTLRIGDYAFTCTQLACVSIPKSVGYIGQHAFADCPNLREVEVAVPDASLLYAPYAFYKIASDARLVVPTGATASYKADDSWKSFASVTEKDGLYIIRNVTLNGESLEKALGDDLAETDSLVINGQMSDADFTTLCLATNKGRISGVNLGGCTLDNGKLPYRAFSRSHQDQAYLNDRLCYVTLPDGLSEIGESAFSHCLMLRSVYIPSSVREIGKNAFWHCTGLDGKLTIPEGVTTLHAGLLENCKALKAISLPSTLSFVDYNALGLSISDWLQIEVSVNRITPPATVYDEVSGTSFGNTDELSLKNEILAGSTLYVPVGAKAAYEADRLWGCFGHIVESSELTGGADGIDAIGIEPTHEVPSRVYTIDGKWAGSDASALGKGLYIMNGKKIVKQ